MEGDFLEKKKVNLKFVVFIIVISLVTLFIIYESPHFKSITTNTIKNYILSFGYLGPVIATLLIAIQTTTMVIPDILTVFASSALFGWIPTVFIALIGSLIGSTICFFIGRYLGRNFILKLTSESTVEKLDNFFKKYGSLSILFARLIPFIPFDITSYLAGVTPISYLTFIVFTAIGELPMTILYAYLGKLVSHTSVYSLIFISIAFVITAIVIVSRKLLKKKNN